MRAEARDEPSTRWRCAGSRNRARPRHGVRGAGSRLQERAPWCFGVQSGQVKTIRGGSGLSAPAAGGRVPRPSWWVAWFRAWLWTIPKTSRVTSVLPFCTAVPPEIAPELFVSMARGQEIAKAEAHLLAYGGKGHGWGLMREILLSGVVICKPHFHVSSMSSISRRGLPSRDQLCGRVGAGDQVLDGAQGAIAQRAPVPAAAGACLFQAPPERSTDVHVADTVCRRPTPVRCVERSAQL